MHFINTRRLPLSALFGLAIAGAGIAAPVDQHAGADEQLILIAESALHGVAASASGPVTITLPPLSALAGTSVSDQRLAEAVGTGAEAESQSVDRSPVGNRPAEVAGFEATQHRGALQAWAAVPAHQLDDMRGGFDTSLNLMLSFGIERAVYLNGALVTTTSFNLPALGTLPHDDASGAAVPANSVALVQNGPGNTFVQARDTAPLAATVIQNTLNNQALQSLTTINAASNSLQILRTNGFQSILRDGLGQVTVPH